MNKTTKKHIKMTKPLNLDDLHLYTAEEVAELLKLTVRTIYEYINNGTLEAYQLGGKSYRIKADDLRKFIESSKIKNKNQN